jgi:hypothetical protein
MITGFMKRRLIGKSDKRKKTGCAKRKKQGIGAKKSRKRKKKEENVKRRNVKKKRDTDERRKRTIDIASPEKRIFVPMD